LLLPRQRSGKHLELDWQQLDHQKMRPQRELEPPPNPLAAATGRPRAGFLTVDALGALDGNLPTLQLALYPVETPTGIARLACQMYMYTHELPA
jgi:hypothetical protein